MFVEITPFKHFQKVFGLRFQDNEIANRIQRLVLDGGPPAMLGFALFEFGDFVHDVLPCPLGGGGITRPPVYSRQVQAEGGGFFVFIPGRNETKSFVLVAGAESGLLFGDEVFAVVGAPTPAEDAVTVLHFLTHVVSMSQPDPPPLASCGRVKFG